MSTNTAKVGRHIVQVRLENFQDHKDTEIRLEAGINLITGSSDAGKSAILRAINFVFHNLPRGKGFIRHGADECRITITFSDGTVVQRIKGESTNAVVLKTANGKGEKFEKIGNDLPQKVLDALGNPPIDAKHGPLAYAEQMGSLFLVGLGSTDLPRAISELTGIDNFQKAAEILGTRARKCANQMRELTERVNRYDAQLVNYEGLDVEWGYLQAQESDLENIGILQDQYDQSTRFVKNHNEVVIEARQVKSVLAKTERIASLKPKLEKVLGQEVQTKNAQKLAKAIAQSQTDIGAEEVALKLAQRFTATAFRERYQSAKNTQLKIAAASKLFNDRKALSLEAQSTKEEMDALAQLKADKRAEQIIFIDEMRKQGMWCETCDRPARKAE